MVMNSPLADDETNEDIITSELYKLTLALKKEGFKNVEIGDLNWELFSRCEFIGIPSVKLWPNEDLPRMFGVQRGYGGGGIHTGLCKTEIDRLRAGSQAKAERALNLFANTFWNIFKRIDEASAKVQGEPLEVWEKMAI